MSGASLGNSYVLAQFRDFYAEIVRLKEQVQAGTWIFSDERDGGDNMAATGSSANAVVQRLVRKLESQGLDAARVGGEYGAALFREAQYVMAALADEVFLHDIDWQGRDNWANNLVETRLFGSSDAGERLFSRAEDLLRVGDPVFAEVAVVYFMALSLGFRGQYHGREDGERINQLKRRLYEFAFRHTSDLSSENRTVFADTYRYTLQHRGGRVLPATRRWYAGVALALLALLLVSLALWQAATSDLDAAADAVIEPYRAGPQGSG